jgi:hypothetical protein
MAGPEFQEPDTIFNPLYEKTSWLEPLDIDEEYCDDPDLPTDHLER